MLLLLIQTVNIYYPKTPPQNINYNGGSRTWGLHNHIRRRWLLINPTMEDAEGYVFTPVFTVCSQEERGKWGSPRDWGGGWGSHREGRQVPYSDAPLPPYCVGLQKCNTIVVRYASWGHVGRLFCYYFWTACITHTRTHTLTHLHVDAHCSSHYLF